MSETTNLKIPLIDGTDLVSRNSINRAFNKIDDVALDKNHEYSPGHWNVWKPNTIYSVGAIVRVESCLSWGFLECTKTGTSGTTVISAPVNEGETVNDGTTIWTLRKLKSGAEINDSATSRITVWSSQKVLDELSNQETTFKQQDQQLQTNIDNLQTSVDNSLTSLQNTLDNDVTSLQNNINSKADKTYVDNNFYNKQQADQNFVAKASYKDERVVIFLGKGDGIRYYWNGTAQQIQINCITARSTDINFQVERQSHSDYVAKLDNWQKIGGQTFNLPSGSVYGEYPITSLGDVSSGDLLRLYTLNDDSDITVQVIILNN